MFESRTLNVIFNLHETGNFYDSCRVFNWTLRSSGSAIASLPRYRFNIWRDIQETCTV